MLSRQTWRRAGLMLGTASLALTTACGGSEDTGKDTTGESADDSAETRVFTADNGEITIPVDPERIVATGYAVPALIEADAELVGISSWERGLGLMEEDDLATYEGLAKVAGETAADTNYEAVAEAKPDLIIIGVPAPAMVDLDLERLESIAPVVALGPTMPDAWRELVERQLDAAGEQDVFDEDKAAYDAKAAELKESFAGSLDGLDFGHLGAFGDTAQGTFQREFAGSWGTNIAADIGATFPGEVAKKGGGGLDVSEYPSIEQLPESLGDVDVITYALESDGSVSPAVQYVLDSPLWANLPAVKADRAFGVRYTEAATYPSALRALDAIAESLAPLQAR